MNCPACRRETHPWCHECMLRLDEEAEADMLASIVVYTPPEEAPLLVLVGFATGALVALVCVALFTAC